MLDAVKRFWPFLLVALAAMAFLGAKAVFNYSVHYPSVQISAPGGIDITFLFNARRDKTSCETVVANITNSILAVCPTCQTKEQNCLNWLDSQHRKRLSAEPLDVPSARLPDGGVMTYRAPNLDIALAACRESERQSLSRTRSERVVCYPPKTIRPLPPLQKTLIDGLDFLFGQLLLVIGGLAFGFACYLVSRKGNFQARLSSLPRSVKRMIMLGLDTVLIPAALMTALTLHHGTQWQEIDNLVLMLSLAPLIAIPVLIKLGLYRSVIRYLEFRMMITVLYSVTVAVLLLVGILNFLGVDNFRPEDAFVYWLLALVYIGGSRIVAREYFRQVGAIINVPDRVIIYGAGDSGAQLAISLKGNTELTPVAFVDDNPDLASSLLYGIKVFPANQLPVLVKKLRIRQVLLAIPSTSGKRRKEIFERIEPLGVRIRTIPRYSALIEGRAKISDIEDISIEELVGRDPVAPIPGLASRNIEGKVVLVTGAGGSIGSELCRQILPLAPRKLILIELSEYALYAINEELIGLSRKYAYSTEIIPVLASVIRNNLLKNLLARHGVNTIYHAAAYKHVPLVEVNPVEGMRNNVIGCLRAAEAAIAENVETFVLVSTDKAVRPTNIMGASKRVGELILQGIGTACRTRFCIVRFGNVLDSSGSVVPLFRRQIQEGGPVTVTHPEITRYFMTIPEAAQLVLQAGAMAKGADVFVLDMGSPVRILDLARRMIHLSGHTIRDGEHPNGHIEIKFTGLRPGEKLYEELLIGNNVTGTEHPLIMKAMEESIPWKTLRPLVASIEEACDQFDDEKAVAILSSLVPIFAQSAYEEIGTIDAELHRSPPLKLVN